MYRDPFIPLEFRHIREPFFIGLVRVELPSQKILGQVLPGLSFLCGKISAKEKPTTGKKLCIRGMAMYRYSNEQISLSDFKQPVGMNLKENNRWVRKARTIPWLEIEKRYAALFTNR